MAEAGYKQLVSYKLSQIAFELGWDLVPRYYSKIEDSRQRDQIKQALRSYKQNIVEGSSERSLSSKLKLDDLRLKKLHQIFEGYPNPNPSNPSNSPLPSTNSILEVQGKEGLEATVNYLIDLLKRGGYLLDKQINAVEDKHQKEGGYNENLLRRRLAYKKSQ